MMLSKPKFWNEKISFISILLLPLTLIFIFLSFLKKKFTTPNDFNIPIICIGNIYIGGTGKTPTSIFLANELLKLGKRPAILKKLYKSHSDEYILIKKYFKNLIISKSRVEGLNKAENSNFNVVILDDGLQDHSIKKDINIICFNQNQLIGNGLVLPSGPLRENLSVLKDIDIAIINGKKDKDFENKIKYIGKKLEIFYSSFKPVNLDQFKNKKLLAIAGIGNPDNFFKLLEENGLNVEEKLVFPDHYVFSKKKILNVIGSAEKKNYHIIMTEKDYYKIHHYNLDKINYLKVSLVIDEKEKLLNKINNSI